VCAGAGVREGGGVALGREEKLKVLVAKSEGLSSSEKIDFHHAKKTNSCCSEPSNKTGPEEAAKLARRKHAGGHESAETFFCLM
jgi:hypothetical protein